VLFVGGPEGVQFADEYVTVVLPIVEDLISFLTYSESSSDEEPIKPVYNKPNFKSQQYSKPKNESVIKTYNDSKPKYFFAD
jgi:hypothetical protein